MKQKFEKILLARSLRKNLTESESLFWNAVRGRKLNGLKFRRQTVIQGFIADFYCPEFNLIIEIDGGIHEFQKEYDKERENILASNKYNILRFPAETIIANLSKCLEEIISFINTH